MRRPPPRFLRLLLLALAGVAVLAALIAGYAVWRLSRDVAPPHLATDAEHFLYGSIGAERDGIPYWIWLALPRVFPEYLPGPGGYASLGLDTRDGRDMPVGMTKAVAGGVLRVGINCALCHTARVRSRAGELSTLVATAPAHQLNWDGYRQFLAACASDPRFTAGTLLAEIDRNYRLPAFERMLYRWVLIPRTRRALLERDRGTGHGRHPFGAGRAAAAEGAGFPAGDGDAGAPGPADMMPVWGLGGRAALYWDGITTRPAEAVAAWALASGSPAAWIDADHARGDRSSLRRIGNYLSAAAPPKYPLPVDEALAKSGAAVFASQCGSCHAPGGGRTGTIVPREEVGTDATRLDAWSAADATRFNQAFSGRPWAFTGFRKTDGYVAATLEGIWVRGPYLHNGSVPTLRDLLNTPELRPKRFWRGGDVLDPAAVGFVSAGADAERTGTLYDTSLPGNGNGGHTYGTALEAGDKRALIEYLKGL